MGQESPVKQRLHITFGKFDALIYTGHLDIAKVWERVLRRAYLPIVYSEGFNPRPRMALASALPLGISSECEILDVSLRETVELDGLAERLARVSPSGLRIFDIQAVDPRYPPLQTLVQSAEYRISFDGEVAADTLREQVERILKAETIVLVKVHKNKKSATDLRALIIDLAVDNNGDLLAHLATGEMGGNMRVDDLLAEMGLEDVFYAAHRFRLHLTPVTEKDYQNF